MTGIPDTNPAAPKWAAAVFGVLQIASAMPGLPPWARAGAQLLSGAAGWFGIHTASKTSE